MSNAIKYGEGKPIEVSVAIDRAAEQGSNLGGRPGPGIAPEHQSRVFERFARFAPSQNYGGFGLGLWIAREIVQAHRGNIAVRSELGSGASFIVELPLA